MTRFKSYSKRPLWFIALLLTAFVAGCGDSNNPGPGVPSLGDVVAPTVTSIAPANAATTVPINTNISATFSEGMDPATITSATFTLTQGATPVSGAVTYLGATATFNPTSNLAASLPFTATITTGAKDLAGNALAANKTWTFTTGTTADITAPTVSSTIPADTATGVVINGNITATFDEAMDPATITTETFTVTGPSTTPVSGTVTYAGTTATFKPTADLAASLPFTATITTGTKDLAGNALAVNFAWTFTTIDTTVAKGPAPVVLGTAGDYVILARSGITNVPTSAITGNMGVSPIASTAITGFALALDAAGTFATSPQVTGKLFAADYGVPTPSNLTTAVSNMEAAYTDAAGRAADVTELGAGNIGGLTLAPGVYKWGTGVSINTNVTLNGGPTDVWIFQIAGGLTQAANTKVILTGGALAKNIFWQVAGVASMGASAHFEGVILSQTAITLVTGASVNGRLLAQTAVTLQMNTVTKPE